MLSIAGMVSPDAAPSHALDLAVLSADELRAASDGWHAVLRLGGATHRLWLKEIPSADRLLAVQLPLDGNFDARAQAARQLWRALGGRPPGPMVLELPPQRQGRVTLALRALDGRIEGNSYRMIAEGLFGATRVPERAWKTHDLRNRTIRLVQSGLALMRGGYRALLRHARRKP